MSFLSKFLLLSVIFLTSSCIGSKTIRNDNTSFLEGYDSKQKKVYAGKMILIIDKKIYPNAKYQIPYLRNFLAGGTGANGLYPNKIKDRTAISTTNKEGYFAANLREKTVIQTGVNNLNFFMNGVNVNTGPIFPIKIHHEPGFYYFGDLEIELETNEMGNQKLKNIQIINNPKTMAIISQMVPQMAELTLYNIADETNIALKELIKNSIKNSPSNEVSKKTEKDIIANF